MIHPHLPVKSDPFPKKKSKTAQLKIHEIKPIEPENIPPGSQFKYYKDFIVQDIKIQAFNTRFRLKVYETPDGGCVAGELPPEYNGKHFGPPLIEFVLYQYYHCHVTQPLLLEQLKEFEISISAGQLNNLLMGHRNPRPLGVVRVFWLRLINAFEIAVAVGHESGQRPRPMVVDSPIQAISLR